MVLFTVAEYSLKTSFFGGDFSFPKHFTFYLSLLNSSAELALTFETGKGREGKGPVTGLRFIFTTLLVAFLHPLEFLTLSILN